MWCWYYVLVILSCYRRKGCIILKVTCFSCSPILRTSAFLWHLSLCFTLSVFHHFQHDHIHWLSKHLLEILKCFLCLKKKNKTTIKSPPPTKPPPTLIFPNHKWTKKKINKSSIFSVSTYVSSTQSWIYSSIYYSSILQEINLSIHFKYITFGIPQQSSTLLITLRLGFHISIFF